MICWGQTNHKRIVWFPDDSDLFNFLLADSIALGGSFHLLYFHLRESSGVTHKIGSTVLSPASKELDDVIEAITTGQKHSDEESEM